MLDKMKTKDLKTGDILGVGSGLGGEPCGAIEVSTNGNFMHVGVAVEDGDGVVWVAESSGFCRATPVKDFCFGFVTVSRPRKPLDEAEETAMLDRLIEMCDANSRTMGLAYPYNHHLLRKKDNYYCSELVEHMYAVAGRPLNVELLSPAQLRENMRRRDGAARRASAPGWLRRRDRRDAFPVYSMESMLWGAYGLFYEFDPDVHDMSRKELVSPHAVMVNPDVDVIFEGRFDDAPAYAFAGGAGAFYEIGVDDGFEDWWGDCPDVGRDGLEGGSRAEFQADGC